MKSLEDFLTESLYLYEGSGCGIFKRENEEEELERKQSIWGCESEEEEKEKAEASITDEKTFKDYAKNKFKIVFGDNLDKEKMNKTIDGILKDNKKLVENKEWGELVGMLNKSFGA